MSSKKALVVDNEKVIVELLTGILVEENYEVHKAYGGLEALGILKEQTFDLILLDLIMPRVGGDRICRFIRQSPRFKDSRIIVVSGVAMEAESRIAELHPDACVVKAPLPIMKKNILSVLHTISRQDHTPDTVVLGREGAYPRKVVQELLFAQRHFEAILNSMQEAVIELDTQHIITYCNPAAQDLLNKKEWELIGRNFVEGFPSEKSDDVGALLLELSQSHQSTTRDLTLCNEEKQYTLCFSNVIRDGALIGVTVVINDITERKLLEQARYTTERLTGVVEMAGTAAHELNQPLAVISGHTELLLNETEDENEGVRKRLQVIFEQVQRLGNLTDKFSNIVSYETKQYGKDLKIVDIDRSVRQDKPGSSVKGFWE